MSHDLKGRCGFFGLASISRDITSKLQRKKCLLRVDESQTINLSQGTSGSLGLASRRRAVSLKEAMVRVGKSK
jgi:hypothetical protein